MFTQIRRTMSSLGLPRPRDTAEERETNRQLMDLLNGDDKALLRYPRVAPQPPTQATVRKRWLVSRGK